METVSNSRMRRFLISTFYFRNDLPKQELYLEESAWCIIVLASSNMTSSFVRNSASAIGKAENRMIWFLEEGTERPQVIYDGSQWPVIWREYLNGEKVTEMLNCRDCLGNCTFYTWREAVGLIMEQSKRLAVLLILWGNHFIFICLTS